MQTNGSDSHCYINLNQNKLDHYCLLVIFEKDLNIFLDTIVSESLISSTEFDQGCGMSSPVCGMVHTKERLLLIRNM